MPRRDDIVKFLNKELNVRNISDDSRNGLQSKGKSEVKKIAFAVDGCMDVFEKAKKENCDMVIVHHGVKWRGKDNFKKMTQKRFNFLKKNKISLYACHLPLDLHNKYGNNIGLANILGLKNVKKFGKYHGISIGFKGEFKKNISTKEIARILDKRLDTKCKYFDFKNKKIKTIGIISGGGHSGLLEAINQKLDCFLTGEGPHYTFHTAKEAGISLIYPGHYATETVCVKLLMPILEKKFKVKTVFIDSPTGL